MKLTIIDFAHHRNGICGAPFVVILFDDTGPEGGRKVAVVFEEPHHCAVLAVDKLANGDIAFGSNSWRGDTFEQSLRQAIRIMWEVPVTLSNLERAARCQQAIAAYSDDDTYTNLIDFLADAMHWCHVQEYDFRDALDTALMHFEAEITGDDILHDLIHEQTIERNQP